MNDIKDKWSVGDVMGTLNETEMQLEWLVSIGKEGMATGTEMPPFRVDTSCYYYERTDRIREIISDGVLFQWSTPIMPVRKLAIDPVICDEERNPEQDAYLRRIYFAVQSVQDYENVLNHACLMGHDGIQRGSKVASIDLRGINRNRLMGFYLQLGQKKFDAVRSQVEEPIVIEEKGSEMSDLVNRNSQLLEEIQIRVSGPVTHRHDQETYEVKENAEQYFFRSSLTRLSDAVQIMKNIGENQLVIPGDGYGMFTRVAEIMGKQVVSGDVSHEMVSLAGRLGAKLNCEEAVQTIERGIKKFGSHVLVLISFLWALAPSVIHFCSRMNLRILVYDSYIYYPGSSCLREYGARCLRGVKDILWNGLVMSLSEEKMQTGEKPLLTQIVQGPIFFDSVKGVRQISTYSEEYPGKIQISSSSLIPRIELNEMSQIHKFEIVDERPVVWIVRVPHHTPLKGGKSYDLDNWTIIPNTIEVNSMIIGDVPKDDLKKYFGSRMKFIQPPVRGGKKKNNRRMPNLKQGLKLVPLQNLNFRIGQKYYMRSGARLTPYVKPLFDDGKIQLVWLRAMCYRYEYDKDESRYVTYDIRGTK